MNFYNVLSEATENERNYLLSSPIIGRCMSGEIVLEEYVEFLSQAYHHVKHTVPLLMAVGARLPEEKEWLREAVAEYIEEELGHQEWILNDIAACGFDKERVRASRPSAATEIMVSYAYDTVQRVDPVGFFGMVLVLEGTSVTTADLAASAIKKALNLPDRAFTYLRSHGAIDQDHIQFFEGLMNKISDAKDQEQIIHSARMFYRLYADIFRTISNNVSLAA
jgi:pyrroloquinoline quinone (PQQ) biosynthesis protein C